MEVYQTDKHYIFVKNERSLWWNREKSGFQLKNGWDLSSVDDIECIGITQGIIGEISLPGVYDPHLLIIKESQPVGSLYGSNLVYKVKSVCILSLEDPDSALTPCLKHCTNRAVIAASQSANTSPPGKSKLFDSSLLMNKTWGAMKSAGSTIKSTTQQAAVLATNQVKSKVGIKDPIRLEKRITEELHKIFDDTDSFYYCLEGDITNNLQRKDDKVPDDRFFWNKHMIKEIMKLNDQTWVLPVIQGFVQVEQCVIADECFTLALVSRRSRFRAGTRYKRRGIDEFGNCANYVETEQILSLRQHQISFTQVRGSVPIFWSQPGYKYRPPPRIDRDEDETQLAFEKHFNEELSTYKSICIINLVEQSGKEKIIGDKFSDHIIRFNSDKLIYVAFDFHYYCRGMKFENVGALIEAIGPEAGSMGFHWRDIKGPICEQKSVFRVNCMDCLDRTNVVETAIGKTVLESQLVKLGLAPPYSQLPDELKQPFMLLWANNGDVCSKQYAGTNALKGDYTRTGERKISGIMKDGMNSANRYIIQHFDDTFRQSVIDLMHGIDGDFREDDPYEQAIQIAQTALIPNSRAPLGYFNYGVLGNELKLVENLLQLGRRYYLARFKDTYRQATIDLMLGNNVTAESLNALGGQQGNEESDALEGAEHARLLVEDCRRLLLGNTAIPIGAFGLIDACGEHNEMEVDTILLLTNDEYIVAEYDSHLDKIVRFENVMLLNLQMIEFGLYQQQQMFKGPAPAHLCIRLNYCVDGVDGYFHMFRSPNIRFFNNVAVVIKKHDELLESLQAIIEFFRIALQNCGKTDVAFVCGGTLQRRKSRSILSVPQGGLPRNLSESHLVQFGSKAISNVAGQFSKLGQSLNPAKMRSKSAKPSNTAYKPTTFFLGVEAKEKHDESSDSDELDSNIYEPGLDLEVEQNPIFNENHFLPSVGIVMSGSCPNEDSSPEMLANKDSLAKNVSDVTAISISSVTDHIQMPRRMLECASPIKNRSPTPEIRINQEQSGSGSSLSSNEMRNMGPGPNRDLTLNLSGSQSENALKQLNKLASPLTKLAKGVQNFGANLDPRKITGKTTVIQPIMDSPTNELRKLEEKFEQSKCKTKLIAL